MNRIARYIAVALFFLLLPSSAFAGHHAVKATLKDCISCTSSQVMLPECCGGTDAHAIGDVVGRETPVEGGDCAHSGLCRQEKGEPVAILTSAPADNGVPADSPGISYGYSIPAADISPDPFFLSPERLTSLYILHCVFLI